MRPNSTFYVIVASTLALIALIAFQVKWLSDSHRLIEEQFDEKVNLALCYAVSNAIVEPSESNESSGKKILAKSETSFVNGCLPSTNPLSETIGCRPTDTCLPVSQVEENFTLESSTPFVRSSLDSALEMAFTFYAVPLDYEMKIFEKENIKTSCTFPYYECALNPLEKNDKHVLSITFPEKENYIFGKLKFMFFSSIIILLFVTSVFIFANYIMLRQKKIAQINTEFFNNMAHEFRTPLTNISLAKKLLSKKIEDSSQQKYLGVIGEESKKLKDQIERVLHLSKLENGEYQLEKENLNAAQLMQEVIEGMDIQIKEKNAQIFFNSKNENVLLQGDRFHLSNAFRNLLDNALKYSCATPEISINIKQGSEGVTIQFEDNGIGICKKNQAEVFNKYQRVNNGDVHNQKGFGIGLAYVKMIVERHQGFIKIFSDLNKGTRFDLYLPCLLYTSPSPRDQRGSRMPSSA